MTDKADFRFPHAVRIRSRSDYLKIQNLGKKVQGRFLILLALRNDLPVSRFGITVSRRNGNAVKRNRIKRRIKEIQRLNRGRFLAGNDIVVVARYRAAGAAFRQLEEEFIQLARTAGFLDKD